MTKRPLIVTKLLAAPCPHATYARIKSPIASCEICRKLAMTILGIVMEELNLVIAHEPQDSR